MPLRDRDVDPGQPGPDGALPIIGDEGGFFPQDPDNNKPVVVPGADDPNRDFDIEAHSLDQSDYETGQIDVSGGAVVNIFITSQESRAFDLQIELLNDSGNVITTITRDELTILNAGNDGIMTDSVPVYADSINVVATNTSGQVNTVDGSINVNTGSNTLSKIAGRDGAVATVEAMQNTLGDTRNGLVTHVSTALNRVGNDEMVVREHDRTVITAQDSGTGSGNAAQLDLGEPRQQVEIHVDTSGAANLTVEVSADGSNWRTYDEVSYADANQEVRDYNTSFQHIRAYLDSSRNLIEMSSKGSS